MTAVCLGPALPGVLDLVVDPSEQLAALGLHRGLHADAGTDHVGRHDAHGIACILVVADQLARPGAQRADAADQLGVSRGVHRRPVRGQAVDARAGIHALAARMSSGHCRIIAARGSEQGRCRCTRCNPAGQARSQVGNHENLVKSLRGLPRPCAICAAASSLRTMAFQ